MADQTLTLVRPGGRAAFPNGIAPEPHPHDDFDVVPFNGDPDRDLLERFNPLASSPSPTVHIAETFPLDRVVDAHRALDRHDVGKLALTIS